MDFSPIRSSDGINDRNRNTRRSYSPKNTQNEEKGQKL